MKSESRLLIGAMVMLGVAASALVVIPYIQVANVEPTPGMKPYTATEFRGREQYISHGCVYCHSQQPRAASLAPDTKRGWGRAAVASDYAYDTPHLLGTMRTGPDLLNIGSRQPSVQWHLGHLYQPRAYVPGSVMPSYPYMFFIKDAAEPSDTVVQLPPGQVPEGKVVVATAQALELVAYLLSLDRTHPLRPPDNSAEADPST